MSVGFPPIHENSTFVYIQGLSILFAPLFDIADCCLCLIDSVKSSVKLLMSWSCYYICVVFGLFAVMLPIHKVKLVAGLAGDACFVGGPLFSHLCSSALLSANLRD